jgi:AP-1-like factor
MERNVALQNIAKRLKEENDTLRRENTSLREELRKLRPERSPETDRKRWREDSNAPYASGETTARKRIKTDGLPVLSPGAVPSSAVSLLPSPSSLVSSPESIDSASSSVHNDPYSPMSFSARSPNPSMYPQHSQQPAMASLFSGFPGKVPGCANENRGHPSFDQAFDMVDCGFCSDDTPCVCRELALQQVAARIAVSGDVPGSGPSIPNNTASTAPLGSHSPPEVKMESRGSISISSTPQIPPATVPIASLPPNNSSSILDNLPAYSPPVPLPRRRPSEQNSHPPIFPIFPAQSAPSRPLRPARSTPANCSGDPSNCLACADDPFGKAFCAALGGSVKECGTCPNNGSPPNPGFIGCGGCGHPRLCGGAGSSTDGAPASSGAPTASASSPNHQSGDTIPCNTAWAQLKSHPNIAFADLTLLAEVVARRSKCTGPRVVLSPDPEMEALARRQNDGRSSDDRGSDDMPVLLTDPHAQYHEREQARSHSRSPLSTTTQEVLFQCGRQRVMEVEADGVRDALALLDGQYQRS